MEKPKRPYCLFKRSTVKHNTYVYYCRFRDENGNYMSPISSLQFSRPEARNCADQKLKEAKIVLPGKSGTPFETFAAGFWDYEGEYIQRKLARGGYIGLSPPPSQILSIKVEVDTSPPAGAVLQRAAESRARQERSNQRHSRDRGPAASMRA